MGGLHFFAPLMVAFFAPCLHADSTSGPPVNRQVRPMPIADIDLSSLSAEELDALIETAAKVRQNLQPPVASEPPQTSEATIDPAWRTFMHGANTILQFRHLGLGWVTVILPAHERATF